MDIEDHLRKFQKELNAGIVSLVLLATLAEAREPQYGYQIAKHLERSHEDNSVMKQGTLYPVLRSLSAAGLLDSFVEPSTAGPPRRYYTITDTGRMVLGYWMNAWINTRDFVDTILQENRHG